MNTLEDYLKLLDTFLRHCRWHLTQEQWRAFNERLSSGAIEQGYSAADPWTDEEKAEHYFRKLRPWQQAAFLRKQRRHRRHRQEKVAP